MDLEIRKLEKSQVGELYENCLVYDFPDDERKPLAMIYQSMNEGFYECLGIFYGQDLVGYGFVVKHGTEYMLDYFATDKTRRGQGIGSAFLQKLPAYLKDVTSCIVEVENPEYALREEEKELQTRRLDFYLRNGFIDLNVEVNTFDVEYLILDMAAFRHDRDQVAELYLNHYKAMLPPKWFRTRIQVHKKTLSEGSGENI